MKHTPGPWKAERSQANSSRWMVWKPSSEKGNGSASICETSNWLSTDPQEEIRANARLIAKAPEMFEVLKQIEMWSGRDDLPEGWLAQIQMLLEEIDNG